jgi:hypothetical protein
MKNRLIKVSDRLEDFLKRNRAYAGFIREMSNTKMKDGETINRITDGFRWKNTEKGWDYWSGLALKDHKEQEQNG